MAAMNPSVRERRGAEEQGSSQHAQPHRLQSRMASRLQLSASDQPKLIVGKSLNLTTLGEGIENSSQLRSLQDERCDLGQGFLFARPLPAEDVDRHFDRYFDRATSPASWSS